MIFWPIEFRDKNRGSSDFPVVNRLGYRNVLLSVGGKEVRDPLWNC